MIPAVAYYRMSSDKQEASIPAQRTEVQAYAAKHGFQIIREYQDEAISGDDTEKRLVFQQMLRDAKEKRDFQAVLCWDQDRFGRFDPLEAGYWIKPLRDAGIYLETVAQGRINWDDFSGRIIYAVQQEGKHAFLRDLSRNTARGMLAKARQGLWLGGPPPYAYAVQDNRLVPGDPREIEVVQWLFRTYAETSASLGDLMRNLNERGIPSPGGGLWHKTAVQKILTRPHYVGDMVWNRRHDGKYHLVKGGEIKPAGGRQKPHRANTVQDWVVVSDTHPALIDRATYAKVQERLAARQGRKTPHPGGGAFLFTGLVFCGHCGSPMHGCTNRHPDRDRKGRIRSQKIYAYRRYICGKYNAHGTRACTCNTLTEKQLVNVILRKIQADFLDPANLERLRQEIGRQVEASQKQLDPDRAKRLQTRLTELDRQIDKGAERLLAAPTDLIEMLTGKLREWQQERYRLRAELAVSQAAAGDNDPKRKIDMAIDQLGKLREHLDQGNAPLFREVIQQMVSHIECWFDQKPYGKRMKSELNRGLIRLRPDLFVSRDVPSGRPLTMV